MNIIDALQLAIQDEKEAVQKYKELARNAPDPETRLLFEQLSREEDSHYKRLNEKLKALKLMSE